jgi:hypothetical protein
MSTKKTTTTTNQYDPGSMGAFKAFTGAAQPVLLDYMKDPQKASYFLLQAGMLDRYARSQGASGVQNILGNARTGFSGDLPAYLQASLARSGRQTGALRANSFLQALLQAEENRRWATGTGLSYQPLQTGQKSVQKNSGLGTWLPQVASLALGAALAPFTGGASLLGAAGAMGAGGGGGAPSSSFFPGGVNPANSYFTPGNSLFKDPVTGMGFA